MKLIIEKLKSMQTRQSTAKTYLSIWRQFNKFLMRLDATPDTWEDRATLFVAHLVHDRRLQSSTVESYLSAIKRTLLNDDYDWEDNTILVRSLTRACRIINDSVRVRLPIHCMMLEFILFEIQRKYRKMGNWYLEHLYLATMCLGYYGLMRIGEMTEGPHALKTKDVFVGKNKRKLLLLLHLSKTHDEGDIPQQIKIVANQAEETGAYANRHFCPFKVVDDYMKLRGPYYEENEQFFVFRDKTPVRSTNVANVLRSAIDELGLRLTEIWDSFTTYW